MQRRMISMKPDTIPFDIDAVLAQMTNEEKAQMCSGRDFWHSQDLPRLNVPSAMMCDGPNGLRKQIGQGDHLGINESIETVCYPTASAMASSFDRDLLGKLGESLGDECQAEKVAMLLGPGVNMKRSPLCGRNFEYFSEDPYLAGELATAYIRGLQSKGVAACVKHFACNNQETRRMSGSSEVDERTLHEIYLPAFEKCVKEGKVRSVMCGYNAVNGTFCAENELLNTEILRKDWGFDGFVVTDWGAVKDRAKGLMAGIDLEMPGSTTGKTERILQALENGELTQEALDKAVKNVLTFVRDWMENQKEDAAFDRDQAHALSGTMAKECAVLLKNEGLLPLKPSQKVALIGDFAKTPRYQGAGSSHIHVSHPVSALECTEGLSVTWARGYDAGQEETDSELLSEALRAASEAEVAVIFAGQPEVYETEGCDREHMRIPENQNELIREVVKVQPNTVVVLHGGSCVQLPWIDQVPSVLLLYLAGDQAGLAAMDLLYGKANPSGKLAETWPLKLEDNPSFLNFPGEDGVVAYHEGIYIGYRYYDKKQMPVLFPFGHGLSYTTFSYTDLTLSNSQITDQDTLTVSCKVKNTGNVAGKEVLQLYVGALHSGVRRAVRELKGFEKVALEPGEEKTVTFTLNKRDFSYYETKIHDWFVESGSYQIEIGTSSRDIRLSDQVQVCSDMQIPYTFTKASVVADLTKTKKGRALFAQLVGLSGGQNAEDNKHLGAGSDRMMNAMMLEMPLGAFVSYGRMNEEQLQAMIEGLNAEE